jgi:hypothetical protein
VIACLYITSIICSSTFYKFFPFFIVLPSGFKTVVIVNRRRPRATCIFNANTLHLEVDFIKHFRKEWKHFVPCGLYNKRPSWKFRYYSAKTL